MEPLIDTQEFLALSSFLNYQLSGEPINWQGIQNLMVPDAPESVKQDILLDALRYLGSAYGSQKRRLGPLAILHPIRATSLFVKVHTGDYSLLELLTVLLHDKEEDIIAEQYKPDNWSALNDQFSSFLDRLDKEMRQNLLRNIGILTKMPSEKYYVYLDRLFEEAKKEPSLAAIKMADRLDNTLDLRIDLHDFTDNSRCYQVIFDILFLRSYTGFHSGQPHPISRKINGAMRLYQLYKNAVFLSLLRHKEVDLSPIASKLFFSLVVASIREAQTILMHIFAFHLKSPEEQRNLLMEVMRYSHTGGFEQVSSGTGDHRLDGLFKTRFEFQDKDSKQRGLASLYADKVLMGQTALGFIIIFANFVNDSRFAIKGISADGIIPQV
ncbi:MAG: hypothetical protein P8130_08030 [Deltaproteobacteria bacterium]